MPQAPKGNQPSATIDDVLLVLNIFADKTEQRFNNLENRFDDLRSDVNHIQDTMVTKTTVVTKEYLDDKMSDLKGDLVIMMRQAMSS